MEIQDSWVYKLKHLYIPLDEKSIVFKNELKKLGLEQEQPTAINFNPNLFYSFVPNIVLQDVKDCYLYIDAKIYKDTSDLLEGASIKSSINAICSLLKQAYYNKILITINPGYKKGRKEFEDFFKKLLQHFEQKNTSQKFTELKLRSNDRLELFTTKDGAFINAILTSFMEKICKDEFTATLLTDIEEGSNIFNNLSPNLILELIFNLVLYIQMKTDFKKKTTTEDILKKQKFSNRLLELVYSLMFSAKLITEKGSEPKDYIRTRLNWFLNEHKDRIDLFDPKKFQLFHDASYFNKIITNKNRLTYLLNSFQYKD